ncbi:alpha/beta hydrolase [Marinobacter vulgaris]|uniref:Alpha/beta hydrolase n=1 Tax=Marinobacter vulgaris TaxID=1928331 RepID=A0A2V3ZMH9_9GAMM|nr:alpha/beta fold hydrolase [Marinobacter vulgaris]PXX90874.1 alpha/beta hydrolase [Marinobacter vulgaris]TSJ70148.1 alpha/beta fold hydrolase [Marinobacter vulgaris]
MNPVTFYESESRKGSPGPRLILAHGAGAPADSAFMERLASALSEEGVRTLRFEFPYMEKRRLDGRKRPPDRQPVLLEHFRRVIDEIAAEAAAGGPIFIGGKSMGGRMASHIIAQGDLPPDVSGAVCFGYPFHPPGKHERWRTIHFQDLQRPLQIIQGSRDPFGRRSEVEARGLETVDNLNLSWLEGGDHDYRPLARQQQSQEAMILRAASLAAAFIHGYARASRATPVRVEQWND